MEETYRRENITATLHQSGLDGKVTKLKLPSKDTWNHDRNLQKYTQIWLLKKKKRFFDLMNLIHVWGKPSTAYHLHNTIPTVKHVAAASCLGGVFQRQGLRKWSEKTESWMQLNTEKSLMKTWFRALRISDWAVHLPTWQSPYAHSQDNAGVA